MTEAEAREIVAKFKHLEIVMYDDRLHDPISINTRNYAEAKGVLAGIAHERARAEGLVEAVRATDTYFKALARFWDNNDGRVVSESGTVVEGSVEVERLCNIAGEFVSKALSAYNQELKENN